MLGDLSKTAPRGLRSWCRPAAAGDLDSGEAVERGRFRASRSAPGLLARRASIVNLVDLIGRRLDRPDSRPKIRTPRRRSLGRRGDSSPPPRCRSFRRRPDSALSTMLVVALRSQWRARHTRAAQQGDVLPDGQRTRFRGERFGNTCHARQCRWQNKAKQTRTRSSRDIAVSAFSTRRLTALAEGRHDPLRKPASASSSSSALVDFLRRWNAIPRRPGSAHPVAVCVRRSSANAICTSDQLLREP